MDTQQRSRVLDALIQTTQAAVQKKEYFLAISGAQLAHTIVIAFILELVQPDKVRLRVGLRFSGHYQITCVCVE